MSYPPLDEPWQEPRAVSYGRANQANTHYRRRRSRVPLIQGEVPPPRQKMSNRRRFYLFTVALLLALAFGAAMFKAVLAGPAPSAQAPSAQAPAGTGPAEPTKPAPPAEPTKPAEPRSGGDQATSPDEDPQPRQTTPKTAPKKAPKTTSAPQPDTVAAVYYKNCGQARKAGAAPLHRDDPGYSAELDKDGDGVACETGKD